MDPGLKGKPWKEFQSEVISRLKRESEDEDLDARSTETVGWMAVELHRRLEGRYRGYGSENAPKLGVYRGEVTSSARLASGIEKKISMHGGKLGKNRLDRRHHAVDAAVIALMQPTVAQILTERNSLRTEERNTRKVNTTFGDWREYHGNTVAAKSIFKSWKQKMLRLAIMLQTALDEDRIPVVENIRLRLGNSLVHEEKIYPLQRVKLGEALSAEQINRAATPALWTALTRLPEHDWKNGLSADPDRRITVNGTRYNADEEIELFPGNAASLKVRGGYVTFGSSSAFHHARLYRITNKGKTTYCMMRVYTVDLVHHRHENLFKVCLPPSSLSFRHSEPMLREALRNGDAEYVTWFVVGDELFLNASKIAVGQMRTFLDEFGDTTRWRIRGFCSDKKLRLKPTQYSAEGLDDEVSETSRKIVHDPGWRPVINNVFGRGDAIIIRRDAHGRVRLHSDTGLPISVKVAQGELANS